MSTIVSNSEQMNLAEKVIERLKNKEFELIETKEGFLLKPVKSSIKMARGFLKGSRFSSKKYMQLKKEEKELER